VYVVPPTVTVVVTIVPAVQAFAQEYVALPPLPVTVML
jgi:hypothetical protein